MVLTEKQRDSIGGKLAKGRALGEEDAETLMAQLDDPVTKEFVRIQIAEVHTSVAGVRTEVAGLRGEMHTEFADVRSEMRTEFANVRSEMRTEFANVRSEIADVRRELGSEIRGVRSDMAVMAAELRLEMTRGFNRMTRWLIGTGIAAVGVMAGLVGVVR